MSENPYKSPEAEGVKPHGLNWPRWLAVFFALGFATAILFVLWLHHLAKTPSTPPVIEVIPADREEIPWESYPPLD